MRTGLLLFVVSITVLSARAQSPENPLPRPVEELPRYGFDRFTVQEGLPESYVVYLMKDPHGYLWVAMQNGLSHSYDIITQGHRGTLAVESADGEGAAFVVILPVGDRQTLS